MNAYLHVKRVADFFAALILICVLSPVFLAIAVAIKLESEGPIFYWSTRVGRGFQIFHFYKFRSMRIHADSKVQSMVSQNAYAIPAPRQSNWTTGLQLFSDNGWIDENEHLARLEAQQECPYFKVTNDPRITRVGHFIRNTSLDELPQLFNVLKGDMSLVGNRPLPLYEAVELTTDEAVQRFAAPAGISGLWQVTERGTEAISGESRKRLDNEYAKRMSFWLDLQILFKTPFAALQQTKV